MSKKDEIMELLKSKPQYVQILNDLLALHQRNPLRQEYDELMKNYPDTFKAEGFLAGAPEGMTSGWRKGKDYDLPGSTIAVLTGAGILSGNIGSNKHKEYGLLCPEDVRAALDGHQFKADQIQMAQAGDIAIPDDMFDVITGYKEAKTLFDLSIRSDEPVNILMVGKYATAKTVFLQEVARLPGAMFAMGGLSTKAGLRELLLDNKPRYLLFDEIDEVAQKEWPILLGLMEDGTVIDTRYGSRREEKINCRVYMATNDISRVPAKIISRFGKFKLHFKEYTKEEYEIVVFNVLSKRYGKDEMLALYIAEKMSEQSRDVRDAVSIAKLAQNPKHVDALLAITDKYKPDPYADKRGW